MTEGALNFMQIDEQTVNDAVYIGNYLNLYLNKEEAILFGDHIVISFQQHELMLKRLVKGNVRVFTRRDAGEVYLKRPEPGQILHVDIFHALADTEINLQALLRSLVQALDQFMFLDNKKYQYLNEERHRAVLDFCHKVYLGCKAGQGILHELVQGVVKPMDQGDHGYNHVHLLFNIEETEYPVLYIFMTAVDNFLFAQGIRLGKVQAVEFDDSIAHQAYLGAKFQLPWRNLRDAPAASVTTENINNFLLKLAEKMGSLDEVKDFFSDFEHSGWFNKNHSTFEHKHELVEAFQAAGLAKKNIFGVHLTPTGEKVNKYLQTRYCELLMQLRRNIRRTPASAAYSTVGPTKRAQAGSSGHKITDYNHTVRRADTDWAGNLAAPQTVVQAKISSLLRNEKKMTISCQDMHSYTYKIHIPVNICLIFDASASMKGEKERTAEYLARYLLLTSKDRIAVVIFQEQSARVVVPFTRQEHVLRNGFKTIEPHGLTPVAHGLDKAREVIAGSNIKKPLVVLLTDGLPNVGLWTHEPRQDAMTAAAKLKALKVNFVCIGIESNEKFLQALSDQAGGAFYVTENFGREDLIRIINYEKKTMQHPEE